MTNNGKVNLDVAHDDHIEDTPEIMQLDSHFEQPNIEINSTAIAKTNNNKIHSHKKRTIQIIEKDYGITRKILEQHFGMTLQDAAKKLHGKLTNFSAFEVLSSFCAIIYDRICAFTYQTMDEVP